MSKKADRLNEAYWKPRLFHNVFTYRGERRTVPGWCVKIQWQGRRKTLRLRAATRTAAAAEAVELYAALVRAGWTELERMRRVDEANLRGLGPGAPRLVPTVTPRKYVGNLNPGMERELFATLTDGVVSEYYALGSEDMSTARARAAELHSEWKERGWAWMRLSYAREATVAVFWMANPMTCTYATLLTMPARAGMASAPETRAAGWRILVVEPDGGVRRALCHWLSQGAGVARVDACPLASEVIPRPSWDVILANREQPAAALRERFEDATVAIPRLLTHGVFEDSDAIFASFSGVREGYLLRRVAPSALLEPLVSGFAEGPPARSEDADRLVSRYFQGLFEPARLPARPGAVELTTREQEVLDLICRGFVDKEVAAELGISVWTVHSHLKRIFAKYGVRTRTEAVVRHLQK